MSIFCKHRRPFARVFWLALLLAIVAALAAAPRHAQAQPSSPAAGSSAQAPQAGSPAEQSGQSEEEQERGFLHAPIVKSIARMLHLSENTTIALLLGINFAIILLCIVIPISRLMPKIIRKRSQTLRFSLDEARKATADARARMSAVEAKLAGLGEEMQKFRQQVEQETLEDEKRIKAALAEESARIVTAAEQEISLAAAQAQRALRNFAANLAIDQASKQVALTPETDRALIAEFVAGVAGDGPGREGKN